MATATYVAATINGVVALMAMALASLTTTQKANSSMLHQNEAERFIDDRTDGTAETIPSDTWPVYLTLALSGMSALGAEVVWTRLLSLLMGGTVYTFSIILAVFLVGLSLGSSMGSFFARSLQQPRWALGACQLSLIGAIAWAALMITDSLPFWPINPALTNSLWFTFQLDVARTLWVVLPSSILWGATFPLALSTLVRRQKDSGMLVGSAYAANTVGAILGALLFSLIIVPQFGTQSAQRTLMGVAATAALLMIVAPHASTRTNGQSSAASRFGMNRAFGCLAVVSVAFLLMRSVGPMPWGMAAYGRYIATYGDRLAPAVVSEASVPSGGSHPDIYCTYVGEGLNGTIAVTKWTSGIKSFHSAGKVQAPMTPEIWVCNGCWDISRR